MATCERITPDPQPPRVYRLELTQDEAQFIRSVMSSCGGDSETSRRKHADAIETAMRNAGVPWVGCCDMDHQRNTIWFNDSKP